MTVAAPPFTNPNYVNGHWPESAATEWQDVLNPATSEVLARVPLSGNTRRRSCVRFKSRMHSSEKFAGLGLMISIDLVRDEKLAPANSEGEAIRDSLLRQGVLVGVEGVYGNVVRFQPPLITTREQIDRARGAFSTALAEVASLTPA
jgi:4-aminobutyrate aminotransferase-like enzyme